MNAHRRGSAAIIALIVLAMTGLTVTTYVRADSAAITSDASSIPGYRAQCAAHAGLCCMIAWQRPALSPQIPPQIAAAFDIAISSNGIEGMRILATSDPAVRVVDAKLLRQANARTRITAWASVGGHASRSTSAASDPIAPVRRMLTD